MRIGVEGVYQTKFGELWERSIEDLVQESVAEALTMAHVEGVGVDIVYVSSMLSGWVRGQQHLGGVVSEVLGVNVPVISVEAACASGGVALHQACLALESGQYERAVVVGVEKMSDLSGPLISEALMSAASQEEREAGLTFPGLYGLMCRAYMGHYGLSREDLALVPSKSHAMGALHDKSHFGFKVTPEQVLKSSSLADPLRLLDASGVSDGAACVVLSSKPSKDTQAMIVGVGQASDCLGLSGRSHLSCIPATKKAAESCYAMAGVQPTDVDVVEVHDCFSIAELIALEDLGLAPKGASIRLYTDGETYLGGSLPVNTSGGLKACGHPVGATGVKQVVELALQLSGHADKRQVSGAKIGLAHNVGGTGATSVVTILQS